MKRVIALLLLIFFNLAAFAAAPPEPLPVYSILPEVDVRSAAALLANADTGEIIFPLNIHDRREPASLTKIMTMLVALESITDWDTAKNEYVTVSSEAFSDITADSSTAGLKIGEELRLEDLLYCVMLQSANEACNVLAEHISGSISAFVAEMNARAGELGLENTHYANPHGLPAPEHYTTAYDMYVIISQAISVPHFMDIAHTDSYVVPPTNKTTSPRRLTTTNSLISTSRHSEYLYTEAKGIKTGYTQAAGYCLASTAEKDNLRLISVVMGAALTDELIRSFVETKLLFEWGFTNFTTKRLLSKSEVLQEIPVIRGIGKEAVTVTPEEEILALVPKNLDVSLVEKKISLTDPQGLYAPVYKDQVLGTVTLTYEGHVYGTVNLLAGFTVEEDTTAKVIEDVAAWFTQPWVKWVAAGAAALIAGYVLFVILINHNRRKKKKRRPGNYNGRKRRRYK